MSMSQFGFFTPMPKKCVIHDHIKTPMVSGKVKHQQQQCSMTAQPITAQ